MKVRRISAKIEMSAPPLRDLIPIYHRWIQEQAIRDVLLIDVHDYSHVLQGPGILLVGHQGDFSLDQLDGRDGLLYQHKSREPLPLRKGLRIALSRVIEGALLLEKEERVECKFDLSCWEFRVLDRLGAPNHMETFHHFESLLKSLLEKLTSKKSEIERIEDPRAPFRVRVKFPEPLELAALSRHVREDAAA